MFYILLEHSTSKSEALLFTSIKSVTMFLFADTEKSFSKSKSFTDFSR